MTTLGLYGDSFVDYQPIHHPAQRSLVPYCWSRRLESQFFVKNYGLTGSSLYWSMRQFENSYQEHDHVVFVVTAPGRWPGTLTKPGWPRPWTVSSYDQCQEWLKENPNDRQVEAVRDWYMWGQVADYELYTHQIMVDKIKALRPDAVVIPINNYSNKTTPNLTDFMLVTAKTLRPDLINVDLPSNEQLAILVQNWEERAIVCHLTADMHQYVFNTILDSLEQNEWSAKVPETYPHEHPWDYYYSKR